MYGDPRIFGGHAVTMCAASCDSARWRRFPALLEKANPVDTIVVIIDNLSRHNSVATRQWLTGHPRIQRVFIPRGACRFNPREAWRRLFRRQALAGQTFADPGDHLRHHHGNHPTQHPRPPLDPGPSNSRASPPPTPFYPPALRNATLSLQTEISAQTPHVA